MIDFAERYIPSERESFWQQQWERAGVYRWRGDAPRGESYVIDTPPPTVSGLLHMGHIYSYTHTDFMARYMRMKGRDVFYPMGFDDNGLPTERLVEKVKKIRAKDVSRETFIQHCEEISAEARSEFRALFTATALSVDWNLEYHTISSSSRRISQASFLDLVQREQVYRTLQPMLWDAIDQTALAQAEVEDKEMEGVFCDIRFTVEDCADSFVIATTRPEMLPACVAIFYHPDDARYAHLAGKKAIVPLFGLRVPILTDETVEPEKGTGIMMCCTFGDEADVVKWRTHKLEMRMILNNYGKLTIDDERLQGLTAKNARTKMIELLEEAGVLLAKKPIMHTVKCAERSGAPLEIIPTYQWFVRVLEHKEALRERNHTISWKPDWMHKRLDQWIDGLNWDWCISRQRYYGVPFPVWYSKRVGEEGKAIFAAAHQLPINPLVDLPEGYSRDEVDADMDVMDTWATSSLTPQLSAHAVNSESAEDKTRFDALFPADIRPQAHEIIRTWAFYTLVKAHLHNQSIPWHETMISGWCLAADKSKMSKSKGNIITPTALLQEKGADAVRYWASTAKLGTDTAFSEDILKIGNKLVNKLWNACKFAAIPLAAMRNPSNHAHDAMHSGIITHRLDQWMIGRMHQAIIAYDAAFADYDYAAARAIAEDVFWNDLCDNYLELVKSRAYGNMGEDAQQSACHTLWHVLNAILKLFAPFVPHITEELFSTIYVQEYKDKASIHARGMFPNATAYPVTTEAERQGTAIVLLLELVRKAKSEQGVSIKYPIDCAYISTEIFDSLCDDARTDLCAAGNITRLMAGESDAVDKQMHHETHAMQLGIVFSQTKDVA
ncbi:MAG: valine--tRNA ligase [Alphaproteobacteria bacterium]|nr:MAG: valine--tRNA ligase [Alphaproteobacteria bacterium]